MKIEKYKKMKLGMYEIILENNQHLIIHEDLILKYELLINKEINNDLLNKIEQENNFYLYYSLSLKYLAKKLRSTKEMEEYLLKNNVLLKDTNKIIDLLKKNKYLDDSKYIKAYINDKINLTMEGPEKIYNSLVRLVITKEEIDECLNIFTEDLISFRIDKLITKYLKGNKNKSSYILKQNIINNLISLGYKKEDIVNILNTKKITDNDEIRKKEYLKIYNKYKRKFSGVELEKKVNMVLINKGFSINKEID